jgi:glycerol-3-phosphate acyltransferase PlsX
LTPSPVEADVAVSAGNTGALMAMAMFRMGSSKGFRARHCRAVADHARAERVLDVGANAGCDEHQLVDFAVMGEAFARAIFGIDRRPWAFSTSAKRKSKA